MSTQSLINQRIRRNSKLILEAKKDKSKSYNNLVLLAEELEFEQNILDINPITEVDLIHNIVHNISDSEILIPDDIKDQFQISYDSLDEIEDPDVRKQVEAEILGESAESELYSKKVKWIADNIHKICDHPNYDTFVFDGQMLICYDKDKQDLMTMKDEMIKYPSNLIGNRNSSLYESTNFDNPHFLKSGASYNAKTKDGKTWRILVKSTEKIANENSYDVYLTDLDTNEEDKWYIESGDLTFTKIDESVINEAWDGMSEIKWSKLSKEDKISLIYEGQKVLVVNGGNKGEYGKIVKVEIDDYGKIEGDQIDIKLNNGKMVYLGLSDIQVVMKNIINEAKDQDVEIDFDGKDVSYVDNIYNIEFTGHMKKYHSGRSDEFEFEPDWFADDESEKFWDENWEDLSKLIEDRYAGRNIKESQDLHDWIDSLDNIQKDQLKNDIDSETSSELFQQFKKISDQYNPVGMNESFTLSEFFKPYRDIIEAALKNPKVIKESLQKDDIVVIKNSDKEELISLYNSSDGMSGMSDQDIDKEYIVVGFDGSNLRIREKDVKGGSFIEKSLNANRFEKIDKLNQSTAYGEWSDKEIVNAYKDLIAAGHSKSEAITTISIDAIHDGPDYLDEEAIKEILKSEGILESKGIDFDHNKLEELAQTLVDFFGYSTKKEVLTELENMEFDEEGKPTSDLSDLSKMLNATSDDGLNGVIRVYVNRRLLESLQDATSFELLSEPYNGTKSQKIANIKLLIEPIIEKYNCKLEDISLVIISSNTDKFDLKISGSDQNLGKIAHELSLDRMDQINESSYDSILQTQSRNITPDSFEKAASDSYGNPRYVIGWWKVGSSYEGALNAMKEFGGKKFHNKQFGGGIIFNVQQEGLSKLCKSINKKINKVNESKNPSTYEEFEEMAGNGEIKWKSFWDQYVEPIAKVNWNEFKSESGQDVYGYACEYIGDNFDKIKKSFKVNESVEISPMKLDDFPLVIDSSTGRTTLYNTLISKPYYKDKYKSVINYIDRIKPSASNLSNNDIKTIQTLFMKANGNLNESGQEWEKVILVPKGSVSNAIKILDKEMDSYFEIAAGRFFRFTDPKVVDKASNILKKFGVAGSVDEIDTSELKQIIQEFKLNQSNPPFNTHISSSSIIDWMENENIKLDTSDVKEIKNMAKPNDMFSLGEAKNLIYQYGGDELANQFAKEYNSQKLDQGMNNNYKELLDRFCIEMDKAANDKSDIEYATGKVLEKWFNKVDKITFEELVNDRISLDFDIYGSGKSYEEFVADWKNGESYKHLFESMNQSNSELTLNDLEKYVYKNIPKIKENIKTYGFDNILEIDNYMDLASLLGIDSRLLKDVDLDQYVEVTNGTFNMMDQSIDQSNEQRGYIDWEYDVNSKTIKSVDSGVCSELAIGDSYQTWKSSGIKEFLQDYNNGTLKVREEASMEAEFVKDQLEEQIEKIVNNMNQSDDSFDWENMEYNQKLTLTRESGLKDKVASKSVGLLTDEEISTLKNSIRLRKQVLGQSINQSDPRSRQYIETWYNHNSSLIQLLGSDGTTVLLHGYYTQKDIKNHLNRLKSLKKIKPFLFDQPITLKVTNRNNNILFERTYNLNDNINESHLSKEEEINLIMHQDEFVPNDVEYYEKWEEPYKTKALKALEYRKNNWQQMSSASMKKHQSLNQSNKEDFIWTYSISAKSFMKTNLSDINTNNASLKEICKAIDDAYDDNGWKVRKSEEIDDIEVFEMIPPDSDESEMEYGFKGAKTKKDAEKAFKKSSFSK